MVVFAVVQSTKQGTRLLDVFSNEAAAENRKEEINQKFSRGTRYTVVRLIVKEQ